MKGSSWDDFFKKGICFSINYGSDWEKQNQRQSKEI